MLLNTSKAAWKDSKRYLNYILDDATRAFVQLSDNFFYEDMDKSVASQSPRMFSLPDSQPAFLAEEDEVYDSDPMQRQETIELVKAYYKIPNRKAAKHMFDLIIAMSKTTYNNDED